MKQEEKYFEDKMQIRFESLDKNLGKPSIANRYITEREEVKIIAYPGYDDELRSIASEEDRDSIDIEGLEQTPTFFSSQRKQEKILAIKRIRKNRFKRFVKKKILPQIRFVHILK